RRLKPAVGLQRPGNDVDAWRPAKVEDTEQVELVGHVLGAADLVAGDVEVVEFAQAGRLDLDQLFGFVLVVERKHVEPQAVSYLRGYPRFRIQDSSQGRPKGRSSPWSKLGSVCR